MVDALRRQEPVIQFSKHLGDFRTWLGVKLLLKKAVEEWCGELYQPAWLDGVVGFMSV